MKWITLMYVVELLLKRQDIQVNLPSSRGDTPLIMATKKGYANIVELFLSKENILVGKANKNGETPISIANKKGHFEVEALLKKKIKRQQHEAEKCFACEDRTPDVVFFPCGHQNMCRPCAEHWHTENKGCPIDRIPISQIEQLTEEYEPPRKKQGPDLRYLR